ncbi:hypothetical protein [Streptomyces iconiensis]|uniref:Integral membrane protein n=1 Tax=Streptomyces iconiensis TaxID=1384038 RepID=A0ABT7A3W2_9ACTN|nr:hypothetical protein [Streptomyces iconiensis]MDJ1136000.1 hypothetical protein [Streptomyces iconiensis]
MSESTPKERDRTSAQNLGIDAEEIHGSLEARRALGPEAESDVVASFLERAAGAIDARVDQRIAENAPASNEGSTDSGGFWLAAVSIGMGIPVTGVATSFNDSGSVIVAAVAWGGIALVNVAYNFRRNR